MEELKSEISLFDLYQTLIRGWKWILVSVIFFLILATIYTMIAKTKYVATSILMPPQQQQNAASAMLSALGSLGGGSSASKSPGDIYVAVLQSRLMRLTVAKNAGLAEYYRVSNDTLAAGNLTAFVKIESSIKDGLIRIIVTDKDRSQAVKIANTYVSSLQEVMKTLAITGATQKRIFFEKQVTEAKSKLSDAELAMASLQRKSGLIKPDEEGSRSIQAGVALQTQIAQKEVEKESLLSSLAPNNPKILSLDQEISTLKTQISKISNQGNEVFVSKGKMIESSVDFLRASREFKYRDELYQQLLKQYEMARIDEANDAATIQALDLAIPSECLVKPNRKQIIIYSIFVGLFFGVVGVLFKFLFEGIKVWYKEESDLRNSR